MLGKYHLDPELARGYQMIFSKPKGSVIECKQALMILLHLLNFVFRYNNVMIKKNHKVNILIEIIVIKKTNKKHTYKLAAMAMSSSTHFRQYRKCFDSMGLPYRTVTY